MTRDKDVRIELDVVFIDVNFSANCKEGFHVSIAIHSPNFFACQFVSPSTTSVAGPSSSKVHTTSPFSISFLINKHNVRRKSV